MKRNSPTVDSMKIQKPLDRFIENFYLNTSLTRDEHHSDWHKKGSCPPLDPDLWKHFLAGEIHTNWWDTLPENVLDDSFENVIKNPSSQIDLTRRYKKLCALIGKDAVHNLAEAEIGNPRHIVLDGMKIEHHDLALVYEANEIKRPEYKKSFGMFLDLLGLEKGECKNREAQFASKDSVFVKPGTAQAKNFEEELGFLYTKSGWENRNLKKFAESLEEIRKTMI